MPMLKHSFCNVELNVKDLERGAGFYSGVLGWKITPAGPEAALFQSPDGLGGEIRCVESVNPARLPLLRVEAEEFAPLLDLAARHNGGYTGLVDALTGEWTVNLRDPDGNLIRLSRPASIPQRTGPPPADSGVAGEGLDSPMRATVRTARPRTAGSPNGRSAANGAHFNGARDQADSPADSE